LVSEPLRWFLPAGTLVAPERAVASLRRAVAGPRLDRWTPPSWLLPHQIEAARRVAGSIAAFRGALLADAVGLGKTYVALAVSTRYRSACAIVPAALASQWRRTADTVGIPVTVCTHESLSRGSTAPLADLYVVDEAHRFRNPDTRRYDRLARDTSGHPILLVTATPVVNRSADLLHLLRLFLPDHGLACFGIRSLELEATEQRSHTLLRAASPLMVARSVDIALPRRDALPAVRGRGTFSVPPADPGVLPTLLGALDALRFPAAGSAAGTNLLRLHTYARLASSPAALKETLRRHAAFLDRARRAAEHGQAPSRGLYRSLLGAGDDLQLPLDALLPDSGDSPPDVRELDAEAVRLRRVAGLAGAAAAMPCPKAGRLLGLLEGRGDHKTIVFTSAVATAHDLARWLGWRQVAVVGGGRARIASGPIALDEVLGLFAPRARRVRPPKAGARVQTLITTDLLSEGLDLQDADGVVNYDLPWTPLRLAQRTGRAARLGATHPAVYVWWFVPPPDLERRLRMLQRLERKTHEQLRLAVPESSGVGKVVRVNRQLEARERFVAPLATRAKPPPEGRHAGTRTAVVRGPLVAVLALRWRMGRISVPEVVAVEGRPTQVVEALEQVVARAERLATCPPSPHSVPTDLQDAAAHLIRSRLRCLRAGPCNGQTLRLRRLVMRRARLAGWERNTGLIAQLDRTLDRLSSGLPAGAAVELAAVLEGHPIGHRLGAWLTRQPAAPRNEPTVRVDTLLCGDGSGEF
jgi:hypothetical protein